jgi:hypothetical protein
MKILKGWDTSGLMQGRLNKNIPIKSIKPDELAKIQAQHDRAMLDLPTWTMFGGVVNLGHRHFQVVP